MTDHVAAIRVAADACEESGDKVRADVLRALADSTEEPIQTVLLRIASAHELHNPMRRAVLHLLAGGSVVTSADPAPHGMSFNISTEKFEPWATARVSPEPGDFALILPPR